MLFEKSLRRDIGNVAGVVFASLSAIFLTTSLIRLLGRAAGGKIDTASVLPLIGYATLVALPTLLVLTLYVAVLLALGRAWRDSEMVIWFASGRSLVDWIRPVLRFALPWVAVLAMIAFVGAPWANRQTSELRQRFERREDVAQIAAGRFRESASSGRVFFVESVDEERGQVGNVFVASRRGDSVTIVASTAGHVEHVGNDRFLVLEQGRRYDGRFGAPGPSAVGPAEPSTPGAAAVPAASAAASGPASAPGDGSAFRVLEFERYGVRLDPQPQPVQDTVARNLDVADLLRDPVPRHLGELAWRIGMPVSALLMVLLAIPLSYANPRMGRSGNLIVALLAYVVYFNLLSLAQVWISQGKVPFAVGVWAAHAVMALVVVALFVRRTRLVAPGLRLRRWLGAWLRPRAAPGQGIGGGGR